MHFIARSLLIRASNRISSKINQLCFCAALKMPSVKMFYAADDEMKDPRSGKENSET
jgi:hypothetical protein